VQRESPGKAGSLYDMRLDRIQLVDRIQMSHFLPTSNRQIALTNRYLFLKYFLRQSSLPHSDWFQSDVFLPSSLANSWVDNAVSASFRSRCKQYAVATSVRTGIETAPGPNPMRSSQVCWQVLRSRIRFRPLQKQMR